MTPKSPEHSAGKSNVVCNRCDSYTKPHLKFQTIGNPYHPGSSPRRSSILIWMPFVILLRVLCSNFLPHSCLIANIITLKQTVQLLSDMRLTCSALFHICQYQLGMMYLPPSRQNSRWWLILNVGLGVLWKAQTDSGLCCRCFQPLGFNRNMLVGKMLGMASRMQFQGQYLQIPMYMGWHPASNITAILSARQINNIFIVTLLTGSLENGSNLECPLSLWSTPESTFKRCLLSTGHPSWDTPASYRASTTWTGYFRYGPSRANSPTKGDFF